MSKDSENKTKNGNYELPELTQKISCPICSDGMIKINRTVHKLPDNEEILILLMQCNKCSYQSRDVISLQCAFKPGIWTLDINDGDLSYKIFRGPQGVIQLPEADFEIEPGTSAGYMITTVEGILERMIKWTSYLLSTYEGQSDKYEREMRKTEHILDLLNHFKQGEVPFTLIIEDKYGGSYVSAPESKEACLTFEEVDYADETDNVE